MGTLTTRASAKELLGIPSAVTAYDAVIDTLVAAVDGIVEDYCDRHFADTTYTEYHDGLSLQRELLLENYPIISITSIHDDVDREYGSASLISSDDYTFETGDDANGIVYLDLSLSKGRRNVKVVYLAGYAAADVPKPLARAADLIVASLYNRRKAQGTPGGSMGSVSISLTQDVYADARLLLDRYKKWAGGM